MKRDPMPATRTFIRFVTTKPMTLTNLQVEFSLNDEKLRRVRDGLHPRVQSTLIKRTSKGAKHGLEVDCQSLLSVVMYW